MLDLSSPEKRERQPPLNHTKKLGNIEFSNYLKSQLQTVKLIFSVQKYLQNHPPFYLNSLLSQLKGNSIQTIKQRLQNEYKALINGKSFLHLINGAIQARKKCINKIKRDITKSNKFLAFFPKEYYGESQEDATYADWVQTEGYSAVDVDQSIQQSIRVISSIFVDMARLRDMSIYLVEQINRWKMRIEEHLDRCQQHTQIKYLYEDEEIYQIVLKDITFIWNSKLSQYIWMQAKQDPFIIRNVILVDQRQSKTLLQKYFLQILYPKEDSIIDKTLQCFQMLAYKYKPKLYNRFEEEQLLIQNYLQMEMNEHQFDQPEGGIQIPFHLRNAGKEQQNKKIDPKQIQQSPKKERNRLNLRGWIFEKQLKKSTRQRVNDIVQTHKNKMGSIRPFNIANYAQKNSIALAYLSQVKKQNKRQPRIKINSVQSDDEGRRFFSQGEDKNIQKKYSQKTNVRGVKSQPQNNNRGSMSQSKMFRSLTKLGPVILEDPKEHLPDTPKSTHKQSNNIIRNNVGYVSNGKQPSLQNIRINSFAIEQINKIEAKIQIEQQQTPLNLSKFYEVFRADTNKPKKLKESNVSNQAKGQTIKKIGESQIDHKKSQKQKLLKFKQLLNRSRKQREQKYKNFSHLPYVRKPLALSLRKNKLNKYKSKERSVQKSTDSYKEYMKVKPQSKLTDIKDSNQIKKLFLTLQAKSIPLDLVPAYVKYLQSKRPAKSRIFTQFNTNALINKLSDPFVHSIIFDIVTQQQHPVGTIVLSQILGGRAGRLKYMMQFMSIQPFQLVAIGMLRIAEELLSTTPCQQVVYPMLVDRLDPISSQFIDLIDADLSTGVQKFGQFTILQKARISITGVDARQRIYVFTSPSNMKKEYGLGLKMMGNYRSLKFDCKCLVFTSNFRLRSEHLQKNTLHKYTKVAIGQLFAHALSRIMTKYHLKQLRQASYGGEGQLGQQVRSDPFLRSVMQAAAKGLQGFSQDLIKTTVFGSMDDLLNYLRYKNLDYHFHLQFLTQSRFILQHQLVLVEVDQQLSLQFTLSSNQQLYILHNYKQHQITQINCSKFDTQAYILPTSNQKIKLFAMSASHYFQHTTDQLDLYTYLSYFFRNMHSQIFLNEVPSIVMPNLKHCNVKVNKVRMYDGFFKLFPQRQFYSAAMLACANYWQSYYPDAVIHQPLQKSIVFQFPFILGFYDPQSKTLLTGFLYTGESENSP